MKFLIFLSLFFLISCKADDQLKQKINPSEQKIVGKENSSYGLKLTSQGNNIEASFSPDGSKICFVSANRFLHKNRQLYELNLTTGIERRVSFSDGDIFSPIYSALGDIIFYASTTDKIKENPILFFPEKYISFYPKDLYSSDPYGKFIQKIISTDESISDFYYINGSLNELILTSTNETISKILKLNLHSKATTLLYRAEKSSLQTPQLFKKNSLYWIENGVLKIKDSIKKIQTPIPDLKIIKIYQGSLPKNRLLFLALSKTNLFEILLFKEEQGCISRVLSFHKKVSNFDYSEKSGSILINVDEDGAHQIYIKELKASDLETLSCDPIS